MKIASILVLAAFVMLGEAVCQGQTVVWNGSGDGTSWSNSQNWVGGQVPGPLNNVVITNGAGTEVVILSVVSVQSILCDKALTIASGSLGVTGGTSSLQGSLVLSNGTSLSASGSNTTLASSGPVDAADANFVVSGGAVVTLAGLQNYTKNCDGANWTVSGANSVLNLPELTNITGAACGFPVIQAEAGGQILATNLTSILAGPLAVQADGAGSVIDLSGLTACSGQDNYQVTFEASSGGTLRIPNLTNGPLVAVTLNPNSTIPMSQIRQLNSITLNGITASFPVLTSVTGTISVSGVMETFPALTNVDDGNFTVSDGAVVTLPALRNYTKDCAGANWTVTGSNSVLNLPALTNITGQACGYPVIQAEAGGQISATNLTSILAGPLTFQADGANSLIDFSGLTACSGQNNYLITFEASSGGTLRMPNMSGGPLIAVELNPGELMSTAQIQILAELTANGVTVNFPALTNIDDGNFTVTGGAAVTLPGLRNYTKNCNGANWTVSGANSVLNFSALTNITGAACGYPVIQAEAGGEILATNLTSIQAGPLGFQADGAGSLIDLSGLTSCAGQNGYLVTFEASDGGTLRIPNMTGGSLISVTLNSNSTVPVSQIRQVSSITLNGVTASFPVLTSVSGTITANGVTVSFPALTNIDDGNFTVTGGAVVTLPALENYTKNCDGANWTVSGSNSVLNLPALTNITGAVCDYPVIQAEAGGEILATNLTSIQAGPMALRAAGVGSLIDLSGLTSCSGQDSYLVTFEASDGGTLRIPKMTGGPLVGVTLNPNSTLPVAQIGQLASITVNGVTANFPLLTNLDGGSLMVTNGGMLSAPAMLSYQAGCGSVLWQASGTGSALVLPSLKDIQGLPCSSAFEIQASSGGQVLLSNLATITATIAVEADGTDSVVALPGLISFQVATTTLTATDGGVILLPQFADLSVSNINAPASAVMNQPVSIVFTITNLSVVSAVGPWQNQFLLSINPSGANAQSLGTVLFTNSIPGGSSAIVTQMVILPAGVVGSIYLGVTVNSSGSLPEMTLTNNTAFAPSPTLVTAADLDLTQLNVPTTAQFGQSVTVSYAVTNIGTASANALWNDQIYLSASPTSAVGATLLATMAGTSPLAPGAGYVRNQSVKLPLSSSSSPGAYYIVGIVDAANVQPEISKANNILGQPIVLSLPGLPDLAVPEVLAPATALSGSTVTLTWTVTNQGTLDITNGAWSETVGTSNASGTVSTLAVFRFTNSLNVGGFLLRTQMVTLLNNTPAGNLDFFVTVNSLGDIIESNPSNNTTFAANLTEIPAALSFVTPVTNVAKNTSSPNLSCLVVRNGDFTASVIVSLDSSATNHLVVPASVTIPPGAPSAPFTATVLDDRIVDANALVLISAQASGYLSATTQVLVINTDVPHLSLSLSANTISQGEMAAATVTSDTVSDEPVLVTVSSSSSAALTVPVSVTIPANSNSISFTLTASQNTVIAPPQTYTVTVGAPGFVPASSNLTVLNVNTPTLALSLDRTNISEADGPLAAIATVSRQPVTDQPLTVALTSTNLAAALVPAQVVIAPYQSSASFYVAAVDDTNMIGPKVTLISAQALDISSNAVGSAAVESLTVQDADGPLLKLVIAEKVVGKGLNPATTAVVSRNTPPTTALIVTLTCSAPSEATVPPVVTIPTGQTSMVFSIASLDDGIPNTSQSVSVTASAAGYASGSDVFAVTDLELPDLVITSVTAPGAALAGQPVTINFTLANQGLASLTNGVTQNIYLTTDPSSGINLLVGTVTFPGPLAPGQSANLSVVAPAGSLPPPGTYWALVTANVGGAVAESNPANDTGVSTTPMVVNVDYTAEVQAGAATVPAGTPVPLTGSATLIKGGPAANVPVNLIVTVHGLPRTIGVTTDGNGNFSTLFTPLATEAGAYTVTAAPPGIVDGSVQAQFNIVEISASPASLALGLIAGGNANGAVSLQNQSDIPLTGLTATISGLPAGLSANAALSTNFVGTQSVITLECAVTAAGAGVPQSAFNIHIASAEGAALDLPVNVTVAPQSPLLATSPAQVNASMLSGGQTVVQFSVANRGGAPSGPLMVAVPNVSWLNVASPSPLPSLNPGQSNLVTLVLTPSTNLALGPYTGQLSINGSRLALQVPFTFNNVSDLQGSLLVQSVDELTFFAAGAPSLTNASVTLTDPASQNVVATGVTDSNGLFFVPSLTAGTYQLNVTAAQHAPFQGTAVVMAGQTNNVQAFLSLQTVSYSWSVVPTQIQAQAQITIQATFVANVPAPVIVPSPTSLDFSTLTQPGQYMDVPLTLANYGLIAVENVALSITPSSYYQIDVPATSLGSLPAHGSITVPMRVTFLGAPTNTALRSKTAAPSPCVIVATSWTYPCGGYNIESSLPIPVFNAQGDCGSSGGGGNGGPETIVVTGGGSSGSSGPVLILPSISIPTSCDPCAAKRLEALASCLIGLVTFPSPIQCFKDAYDCGKGLAQDCINSGTANGPKCTLVVANCLNSGVGCAGKVGAAFAKKIPWVGWALTALSCANDICNACNDIGYTGPCGSTPPPGGGTGAIKKEDARAVDSEADALFAPLFSQANGLAAEIAPDLYFFNNLTWFSVTDTNTLATLLNQFGEDIETNSDGGFYITAAERAGLLALPLPAPLALSDMAALIDRWNLTMSNYAAEIFDVSQVTSGGDTNFIDFDHWVSLNGAAATALQTYMDEGYADAGAAWAASRNTILSEYQNGETGVCAEVVLQIDQTAVLTFTAFHATLQLNNNGSGPLMNVTANLVVQNQAGQDVTSLFAIQLPTLSGGLTAVDGTGTLTPGASGSAQWTLVPTEEAAPEAPTNYLVSGSLSYTLGATTVTIPLAPTTINVQPDPQLYLKYFLQRDVFGDDPYTPQIEPSIPFPLAVMVQNQGYGTAYNFQITSAQPQIVDNEKGLLIGFDIIGAQVDAQPVAPSLTVNFGDISPQQTEVGIWYLTCSLDGQFVAYKASFQNVTSIGNTQLSVIDGVEIHSMTHLVRADGAWDDGLPDFLVNDIPNVANLPDTLYLSSGQIEPVSVVQSASVSAPVNAGNLQVQLTANFPAGFAFVLLSDPANGQFTLTNVLRSDGSSLFTNDYWITDRTFQGIGQRPLYQTNLQLFVYHTNAGPDTLTLFYAAPPVMINTNAPVSSVFSLPAQSPPTFGVVWSGAPYVGAAALAYFDIYSSDNGGPFAVWQSQTTNNSAIFQGTPGHTYSFYSIATDVAGHREATPVQPQAQTTVVLNTNAPAISVGPNVILNAGQTLSLNVTASDPNPQAVLSFSLVPGAPAGAVVDPLSGHLIWPTSPAFGGTTNLISVIVTDNGQPPLSATGSVTVVVQQTISPPTLAPIANYNISESELLAFTNSATETNLPPRTLTFSLGAGAPTNATIDPVTGVFQWRPTAAQAPSTNVISVIVTDNGTPPLSAAQQFTVIVNPVTYEFVLGFGFTNLLVGGTNSVPVTLETQLQLTNITALLQASTVALTNLTLSPASPEIVATLIQALGSNQYAITFTLNPLLRPGNPSTLAQLGFLAVPQIHSSIVPLDVSQLAGLQTDGQFAGKPGSANGRVIVVGLQPVLDASFGTNPNPVFTIYGNLGSNYQMAFSTNLPSANWQPVGSILITNLRQNFNVNQSAPQIYYRAQ